MLASSTSGALVLLTAYTHACSRSELLAEHDLRHVHRVLRARLADESAHEGAGRSSGCGGRACRGGACRRGCRPARTRCPRSGAGAESSGGSARGAGSRRGWRSAGPRRGRARTAGPRRGRARCGRRRAGRCSRGCARAASNSRGALACTMRRHILRLEAHAFAVHAGAGVAKDREDLGVAAELHAHVAKNLVGVALDELEAFLVEDVQGAEPAADAGRTRDRGTPARARGPAATGASSPPVSSLRLARHARQLPSAAFRHSDSHFASSQASRPDRATQPLGSRASPASSMRGQACPLEHTGGPSAGRPLPASGRVRAGRPRSREDTVAHGGFAGIAGKMRIASASWRRSRS